MAKAAFSVCCGLCNAATLWDIPEGNYFEGCGYQFRVVMTDNAVGMVHRAFKLSVTHKLIIHFGRKSVAIIPAFKTEHQSFCYSQHHNKEIIARQKSTKCMQNAICNINKGNKQFKTAQKPKFKLIMHFGH